MSHLDSPLERLAALERASAGMRGATGATLKANPNEGFVGQDLDGDGKMSLAERLDADGDGKICGGDGEQARGPAKADC